MENKIGPEGIFRLVYFEYGETMDGSFRGMQYRVQRDPLEGVAWSKDPHKNDDAKLLVTIWPEPFCYEATPDDQKETKEFPYSEEGRLQIFDLLNQVYEEKYK